MRQKSLLKTMLLLCALIVGSGSAWATDYIINGNNFNSIGSGTGYAAYNGEHTIGNITIVSNDVMTSSDNLQIKKSTGYIYNKDAMPDNITKITLSATNNLSIFVATSANTETTSVTSGSTISGSYKYFKIKSTGGAAAYTTITVTYSSGLSVIYNANDATSGEVPVDANAYASGATVTVLGNTGNLAKTGNAFGGWNTQADGLGTNYSVGGSFNITANTTLYAKWTPYTITAGSNNDSYGTVSLSGNVITGSPESGCRYADPAYTVDPENSAEVSQEGDVFAVIPSANTTVTIYFEPIPTHTVTFSVNGTTTTQEFMEGATITFPANPAAIDEKVFVGWVKDVIEGTTDTEPTFVTSATMGNSDDTFYACFAEAGSATSASLTKMTSSDTFTADDKVVIVASDESDDFAMYQETIKSSYVNKYTFDNNAATVAADDKNWFTVSAGSSTGTWKLGDATNGYVYNSDSNNLEISTNNSTDFTLAWNSEYEKFTLTGNSRWLSYRSDLSNKYFRMGGATSGSPSGVVYFDIYKFSSISYSGYCTTVVAAAVAKPVITLAENPFLFSTTATITCATEGASIKYSFDGETWSDYSTALTITETQTIYAKATKGSDESAVVSVTAKKNLAEPTVTVSGDLTVDLDGETNVSAGTLSAAVTYNDAAVEGASVTWSSSDNDIATIDASTGAVTLIATGEVTFTATYAANSDYTEATGTKTISIIDSNEPGATVKNPYTVAQARAAIDAGTGVTGVYVKGIVSQVDTYSESKYITYWISEDGTTTNQFEVYKGLGIGGEGFSALTDVKEGDKVVVNGNIKKYNSTYEFDKGNQLVSKETLDFAFGEDSYSVEQGGDLTITASSNNSSGAITYSSSATDVAEINASTGVVTAKKEGEATITATIAAADGFPGKSINTTLTVTDSREAADISFANAEVFALDKDGTYTQAATVSQSDYDGTITYEIESFTSDGALIDDATGELLFEYKGTITVKATAGETTTYKSNTATYTLKVRTTPTIVVADQSIAYNNTYIYDAATNVEGGTVTLISENTSVATVTENVLTGIAVGTSTITVSTAANDEYIAGSESFILTITAPEGVTTAPNAEVTYTFDFSDNTEWKFPTSYTTGENTYTKEGKAIILNTPDATNGYKFNTNVILFGKEGATLTLPAFDKPVTKISTTGVSGASSKVKQNIFVGSTAVSQETTNATGNHEYIINSEYQAVGTIYTFKVTNANNTQLSDLTVHMRQAPAAIVKLNKYGYATYCSEYPIDFSSTTGYTAWRVSEISGSTITFEQITDKIKGGQGVLLYNKDADGVNTSEVTINFADGTTEFNASENLLEGTLAPTYVEDDTYYGLKNNAFVPVSAGTIPAGKALLPASAVPSGARLTFVFEEANGISAVESVKTMAEGYYNLQGQRIDTPKKGLYIVNGKKVIIK